jgi:hypothetical protein
MRLFAARTEKLRSSRALVKLLNDELHPDDLFTDLVGDFDDVPSRRWLQAVAITFDSAPQLAAPGSDACRHLHVSLASDRANDEWKTDNT